MGAMEQRLTKRGLQRLDLTADRPGRQVKLAGRLRETHTAPRRLKGFKRGR